MARDWTQNFAMKKFFQKGAAVILGVVSILALIGGSFALFAAVADGFYYRRLHAEMMECAAFVRNHIGKNPRYPTAELLDDWGRENDISHRFRLGGRGSSFSVPNLAGEPHHSESGRFRIAHWDGDRFEFFNSWDESFTTSIRQHSGGAALYGLGFLAVGVVSFRMRGWLKNAKDTQGSDASNAI